MGFQSYAMEIEMDEGGEDRGWVIKVNGDRVGQQRAIENMAR